VTICAILLDLPAENAPDRSRVRRIALAALAALCRPVVVPGDRRLREELCGLPIDVIDDTSMAAALETALTIAPHLDGAILLRPDQPNVNAMTISRLCSTFRTACAAIVASEYDQTIGLPALFGRSVLGDLLALPPGTDPKRVIAEQAPKLFTVAVPEASRQIDSMEEYALLQHGMDVA